MATLSTTATPACRADDVHWRRADLAALLHELRIDSRARYLWSYGLGGGECAGTRCDWFVKDPPVSIHELRVRIG